MGTASDQRTDERERRLVHARDQWSRNELGQLLKTLDRRYIVGIDLNDRNETIATKKVFGDHAKKLAMSSTKSMTGHALGAAGGIEAGITALAITRGVLPPTTNYETPDPDCDLDYVPNVAREVRVDHAISNSFGFGGTNAALVLSRYKGD